MTAIIECHELVRIFSSTGVEVQALQGLDLMVEPGELTAVVGASGSGKSTLLTILSGLDTPSAGRARVAGHDLLGMGRRERVEYRRHTVGFIWQQTSRNLLPYLSAAENVSMALLVSNFPRRRRGARVTELLNLLGMADLRDRRPSELSGGQQQRVAVAVALANAPEVLLADEPTGELDEANSALVLETFRSINEQLGTTVLIVTHDSGVSEHVRRTMQIRDGRTATEVLRSTRTDGSGTEHDVAEEFAILDRVGRMQLPHEYITGLGMRDRVRLALADDHVKVSPVRSAKSAKADDDPSAHEDEGDTA
jgi:ABC-type lipoprotein export system ATPase subunit